MKTAREYGSSREHFHLIYTHSFHLHCGARSSIGGPAAEKVERIHRVRLGRENQLMMKPAKGLVAAVFPHNPVYIRRELSMRAFFFSFCLATQALAEAKYTPCMLCWFCPSLHARRSKVTADVLEGIERLRTRDLSRTRRGIQRFTADEFGHGTNLIKCSLPRRPNAWCTTLPRKPVAEKPRRQCGKSSPPVKDVSKYLVPALAR